MKRVERLMGTVFAVEVFDAADAATVEAVFEWLRHVEATFSTFREDSEISRIGRGLLDLDAASSEVRHVLARCDELEVSTEQRFVIRPGRAGGPGLDPSGFVKGWSVDEAALILRSRGVSCFTMDACGYVLCVGQAPFGDRWRIGVRHPGEPDAIGAVLRIHSGAVATSGTYFRGGHIWGRSDAESSMAGVTVVGPSLGVADALATAIYADQAASLAWMSRFPDYGVVLMTSGGRLRWTEVLNGVIDEAGAGPA